MLIFAIYFAAVSLLMIAVFAIVIPLLISFGTNSYQSSEFLIQNATTTAQSIQDVGVRTQFLDSLNAASASVPTQIEILSLFYQYSWLITIVIVLLIFIVITRKQVESESFA